jgi:hypothetical protein
MYEPLMLSIKLKRHEEIKKAGDFYTWVRKELDDSQRMYMKGLSETVKLSCEQLAELHGLFWHWGHPTVHKELGCEKTRVTGQTRSHPKLSTQMKMLGLLKRQFYVSFVSKHGRSPVV